MANDLSEIDGCVFDAYGTLFDLGSALAGAITSLGDRADRVAAAWRLKQIEYTQLRSLMGRYTDFETVTRDALRYALKSAEIEDRALEASLMESYFQLRPYPDACDALSDFSQKQYWCAILSNGSPRMLNSAVSEARLDDNLDAVLSVEAAGIFKPHPSTYRLAVAASGIEARRILFVSSNPWDVAGASTFGFRTAWINRGGVLPENVPGTADIEISSLADLKSILKGRGS